MYQNCTSAQQAPTRNKPRADAVPYVGREPSATPQRPDNRLHGNGCLRTVRGRQAPAQSRAGKRSGLERFLQLLADGPALPAGSLDALKPAAPAASRLPLPSGGVAGLPARGCCTAGLSASGSGPRSSRTAAPATAVCRARCKDPCTGRAARKDPDTGRAVRRIADLSWKKSQMSRHARPQAMSSMSIGCHCHRHVVTELLAVYAKCLGQVGTTRGPGPTLSHSSSWYATQALSSQPSMTLEATLAFSLAAGGRRRSVCCRPKLLRSARRLRPKLADQDCGSNTAPGRVVLLSIAAHAEQRRWRAQAFCGGMPTVNTEIFIYSQS